MKMIYEMDDEGGGHQVYPEGKEIAYKEAYTAVSDAKAIYADAAKDAKKADAKPTNGSSIIKIFGS